MKKILTPTLLLFIAILNPNVSRSQNKVVDSISFQFYKKVYESQHHEKEEESEECVEEAHFYRWLHQWYGKLNSQGKPIFKHDVGKILKQQSGNNFRKASNNWTSLGPNNAPSGIGRINVIQFHPNDPNTLFAGAPAGGFWKTTDGGKSWITTTDHLTSIGVSDIAVNKNNPDEIFIGTGDKDLWSSVSIGVLKSNDGGNTWNETGLTFDRAQNVLISRLLISPDNENIIYAAEKGPSSDSSRIYKSIDKGLTWKSMYAIFNAQICDFEISPANSNTLYFSTENGLLFKSDDAGNNWQDITAKIPFPNPTTIERLTIDVSKAAPNALYLLCQGEPSNVSAGIYVSDDEGNTFYKTTHYNSNIVNWFGYVLKVSDTDPNSIYCGGGYAFYSNDKGVTWNRIHTSNSASFPNYVHVDMHDIKLRDQDVFIGCDGGIYQSTNPTMQTATWERLNGNLTIGQVYHFSSSPVEPTKVVAGFQDNGCGMMTNGDYDQQLGGDGMYSVFDPFDSNIYYVSYQTGYFFKTTNGGLGLSSFLNPGDVNNEGGAWTTPLYIDPNNASKIWAGYQNVWQSTDGGNSWNNLGEMPNQVTIKFFKIAPSDENIIYVEKEWGNGTFRSTDGGAHWTPIYVPTGFCADLTISENDPLSIWLCARNKVFYSSNGGDTWTDISGNLELNNNYTSIIYQANTNDRIIVGSELGVYFMENNNDLWYKLGSGLPNVNITKLEYVAKENTLRCSTYGRGIWEYPMADIVMNVANYEHKIGVKLYPIPTRKNLNIVSETTLNGTLEIFDIQGISITKYTLEGNSKSIQIDVSKFKKGIYFIKINTNEIDQFHAKFITD
jgi:photosystem II stability/assembly factor-like uncharacterized protein